ncbi:GPR1/FUN34/YaaH family transporter [Pseudonocardia sp.]|uniref:GPR1/FUN34/YaaH family transporter n=1 Tax=Pseudonocardia sp. TaxID=60912 RepID=UPI003D0EB01B
MPTGEGRSAVASIVAIFGAFWTSFGFLVVDLVNNLFGVSSETTVAATQVQPIQATFLIAWLVVFVTLTLATLRLPLAVTLLFALVDIAVALVLGGVLGGSTMLLALGWSRCLRILPRRHPSLLRRDGRRARRRAPAAGRPARL